NRLVAKKYFDRSTSKIDKRETAISITNTGLDILEIASKKWKNSFNHSLVTKSAESGLRHEEYNAVYEEVKFLQIWIERNCKILH
ncbi:MAG TPA: hypothetical protein VK369_08780, partial [Segetibacter sp.]|nr:hypothetical protein [Segetibacter sp.]